MTTQIGATGPPQAVHEKAALVGGSLNGSARKNAKVTVSAEDVKREARQHLERWLMTGHSYYLALARAQLDAARKGDV
jgi:hypothetical protein